MPVLQQLELESREFSPVDSSEELACHAHSQRPGTWVLSIGAGYPFTQAKFLLPLCHECAEPLRIWLNNVQEVEPEPDDDLPF